MKFSVICADPCWSFSDKLKMSDVPRGASANYSTLSFTDIKNLKVKELVDPDGSLLALWVPSSLLKEGLEVMQAWGFSHKQTFIWVKTKLDIFKKIKSIFKKVLKNQDQTKINEVFNSNHEFLNQSTSFGMGRLFRQSHEICLIGISSPKIYKKLKNKSQRSVCFDSNFKHSQKPEKLQDSLELMFPNQNYLELFARRDKVNWITVGNECPSSFGEDIRESIEKLIIK
jgi:N6-adenosine-specific RNA methylase IME4